MKYLSVTEAASILELSPVRVRQMCQSGQLPAQKVGGVFMIAERDVTAFKDKPRPPGRPKKAAK